MEKSVLLGLLGLTVCLFTACSSDNNDDNNSNNSKNLPTPSGEKMIRFTDSNGMTYSNFKYDSQDRLVSFDKGKGSKDAEITYVYSSNFIKSIYSSQNYESSTIYTLVDGRITKAEHFDYDKVVREFSYDAKGQIEKILDKRYDYGNNGQINSIPTEEDITIVTWDNGNISNIDGSSFTYTDYSIKNFIPFEEDLFDCVPITLYGVDAYLLTQGYYGKCPRYLVKTVTFANGKSHSYNYERDKNGNVVKVSIPGHRYTAEFTWQ